LVIDPDAVLSSTVALQRLKTVGRKTGQILKPRRGGKDCQTAARLIGKPGERLDPLPGQELRRPLLVAASDHSI
jgi:hypothetical protein